MGHFLTDMNGSLLLFLVLNSAFGRHRHWLIPMESPSFIIIVMSSIIHHGLIFRGDPPNIKPWWMIDDITMMMNEGDVIGINQCLCLPKAELNTKNSTRRRRKASSGWVFGVQLDSLEKSNSDCAKTNDVICFRLSLATFFMKLTPAYRGSLSFRHWQSSWNPKTQQCGSRAATWLSFWCSTRSLSDTGAD